MVGRADSPLQGPFCHLNKLGRSYASKLHHLAHGMVDLPSGKMKSQEGSVVEADGLMAAMEKLVAQQTSTLGKVDHYSPKELAKPCKTGTSILVCKMPPK